MTFNEMQMLAFMSQKVRGDCFVLMSWVPRKGVPYDLRLQLIEADRVSNPDYRDDDEKISGGIERDAEGVPIAIHVQTTHPGNRYLNARATWKRIPIFGEKTGRRQVLHLMEFERIDQSRGEPGLAPVIETLKQVSRYSEAELSAAVVNAVLSVFVKRPQEGENPNTGQTVEYTAEQREAWEKRTLELGPGTWVDGAPGEELQIISATRPNAQFDPFFAACIKQIGMALGVPFEVLAQYFQSSYSASRAALLEFTKNMKILRVWLRSNLCQLVYEEFLTEAVIKGRLTAPGFLTDPVIRAAYCKAEWMGSSAGQIDPVKEVEAAYKRVLYGFSTFGKETAEISGADFEQTSYTREEEFGLLKKLGLLFENLFKTSVSTGGEQAGAADSDEGDKDAA
jgi:lambda family phage portal protein